MAEIHASIVQARATGKTYRQLAEQFGLHSQTCRKIVQKAVRGGLASVEQMRISSRAGKVRGPQFPVHEYNRRWVARVRARTVVDANGCWIWQGFTHPKGYGQTSYRGKNMHVHRGMYMAFHGQDLTPDQAVCHKCDVRRCCSPDHLWLGNYDLNNKDMAVKGRCKYSAAAWPTCKSGHPFTPENTRITRRGFRACKTCQRVSGRIRAGWTLEQALSMPVTPKGRRPIGAKFPRRKKRASQSEVGEHD